MRSFHIISPPGAFFACCKNLMTLVHGLFKDGIVAELVEALTIGFVDRLVKRVLAQDLSSGTTGSQRHVGTMRLHAFKFFPLRSFLNLQLKCKDVRLGSNLLQEHLVSYSGGSKKVKPNLQ